MSSSDPSLAGSVSLDAISLGSEDSEASEAHTPIADLRSSGEEGKGSSSSLPGALCNCYPPRPRRRPPAPAPAHTHADLDGRPKPVAAAAAAAGGGGWPLVSVNAQQCG
jgi:hypothetical protein